MAARRAAVARTTANKRRRRVIAHPRDLQTSHGEHVAETYHHDPASKIWTGEKMATLQSSTATTAAASTANVLSGTQLEFMPFTGRVRVALTAEAAGESRVTIAVGMTTVVPESSVSRQNRPPLIPDDVFTTFRARQGQRLIITHRNTGAGTNTLFWRIDVAP